MGHYRCIDCHGIAPATVETENGIEKYCYMCPDCCARKKHEPCVQRERFCCGEWFAVEKSQWFEAPGAPESTLMPLERLFDELQGLCNVCRNNSVSFYMCEVLLDVIRSIRIGKGDSKARAEAILRKMDNDSRMKGVSDMVASFGMDVLSVEVPQDISRVCRKPYKKNTEEEALRDRAKTFRHLYEAFVAHMEAMNIV